MKDDTFENTWERIQRQICPGATIRNWTEYRGYFGTDITIRSVTPDLTVVDASTLKASIKVPRSEFRKIWTVWADYKSTELNGVRFVT